MADSVEKNNTDGGKEGTELTDADHTMKDRKVSWTKLRRLDSLNLEAGIVSNVPSHAAQ
ncbi:Potassium transporter, partial [Thalictrum thalictroides]